MIKNFKEFSFVKMAVVSAILFFMIVMIIELFLSLFRSETLSEITTKILSENYLISKALGSIAYGLIIAFFYKRKAKKAQKKSDNS
ncbi:MAG: hypothetical protein ABFR32_07175 [Bacteroidota bacterium]